jgi:Tfp pilus assembly protein PilF
MASAAVLAKQSDSQVSPALGPFTSPEKRTFVLSLLLIVFTLGLYNPANHFSFINYDDCRYVYENVHVRAGLTGATIRWAFTSLDEANWHPLTWMSHALDCQIFHLNPAGHHFTNILLHAWNGVLLFLLLARSTGKVGRSFFVAAVFALHPMNVESVAWVAERKNVLSTTFFFLTLGAYAWYALRPGWKRYLAMAGLLACGLASKPMLVTTPFVLLLLDYWPLGRIEGWTAASDTLAIKQSRIGKLILEKLPLLLLIAASSIVTMRAQRAAGALGLSPTIFERLKNGIYAYAEYLGKAIWPARLTLFYPYAGNSLSLWMVSLAAVLLIAISWLVFKLRSRGYPVVGWLWFLGTLVPVIGVVQVGNQAMADRYAYIPLIGVFVMVAWIAADMAQTKKLGLALCMVPAVCVVLALSIAAYRQIGYWRDSVTVWTHALQVTQHNYVAEDDLGEALVHLHRVEEAYPLFVQAARDNPIDPAARLNIGTYLFQHGHQAEAIQQYELAIRFGAEPGLVAMTYANLGSAFCGLGDFEKARASFAHALQLNPYQVTALQGMSFVSQREGKSEDAAGYLAHALELQPSGEGYLQLARLLAQTNHRAEAVVAYQQAVKLAPELMQTPPMAQEQPEQH